MYTNFQVIRFVEEHFVPVRVHVKEQAEAFKSLGDRYDAHWTPTVLLLDAAGEERHRIEGFLPADDFLAQLALGVGKTAFSQGRYADAEENFRQVLARHPEAEAAAGLVPGRCLATRPPGRAGARDAASSGSATRERAGPEASVWG